MFIGNDKKNMRLGRYQIPRAEIQCIFQTLIICRIVHPFSKCQITDRINKFIVSIKEYSIGYNHVHSQ